MILRRRERRNGPLAEVVEILFDHIRRGERRCFHSMLTLENALTHLTSNARLFPMSVELSKRTELPQRRPLIAKN
jgi:hypothetical protein